MVPLVGFVVVLAYVAFHWGRHGFRIMRVKSDETLALAVESGATGGVVSTIHYDEKVLSEVSKQEIRRNSVGSVTGVTGGIRY